MNKNVEYIRRNCCFSLILAQHIFTHTSHIMDFLYFRRITDSISYEPIRGTAESVGFDLRSPICTSVPPLKIIRIKLNISLHFPSGVYGRLASRSGLATNGIVVLGRFLFNNYMIIKKSMLFHFNSLT
jgi:hypothetical protein